MEVKEDIDDYRIRKIRWAISEMIGKGFPLTPYQIQIYPGFDGNKKKVRKLILDILYKKFDNNI